MALFRRSPDRLRARRLKDAPEGPVRDYLSVPLPDLGTSLEDLPLLAIDLETTGLEPETDHIISIGYLPVDGRRITLGGAAEIIVRTEDVGESATIHGITDDEVAEGIPLAEALNATLRAMQGRVLLAHNTHIEEKFLQAACRNAFGYEPEFAVVDTLALGHDFLMSGDEDIPRGRLRLSSLREQFGLPRYKAHNALTDALACAEVYLALTEELGRGSFRQIALR